MTIHELLQAAGLTANDEIPIWDADGTGEPTKKITAQQLAAAVVTLANLVTSVNNQTGAVSITPANIGAMPVNPASIELTRSSGGAFIDFHYNGSTSDNTVRLMESAEGVLSIKAASDTAYYPILTTKNGVAKSGDTMTGPLTVDANIMQPTGYISGDAGTLNHAIKLGHIGDNVMEFNEYGGLYNFYRNQSDPRELIFQINGSQGASAAPLPVTSGGTGATDAPGARANLGITPANIGAVAKSGDTMTGPLKWGSAAALPAASSLQYFLGIDAFADGGTTHYITAANLLAAIGAVAATGSRNELTAGPNITNKNTNVRKWGKFGVLELYFEVTAQINAYATIFTATSAYKPDTEYNACVSDLSGKCYPVYYSNNGILYTRVVMPAGNYSGNISFCVL